MEYFDCEVCYERVHGSEDYINHLQFSHNVTRGFRHYISRAFTMKAETICDSEIITLDEDDQDMVRNPDHEGNQSDLDQNLENLIREKVKQTMEELFRPIKTLLTENVVPGPVLTLHEKIDASKAEEELLRSFGRMRNLVNQMNFSKEMFGPLPTPSDPFKPPSGKTRKTTLPLLPKSPARSEKSTASSRSVGSLYQCPKCDLKITKKQMRENENAKHLSGHHKVDQKTYDSDRESFHFKKVQII